MTDLKLTVLAALSGLVIVGCLPASVIIIVPASSNIFLAGQPATSGNTTPACTTTNLGCLPPELDFIPVAGNVLTFAGPGVPCLALPERFPHAPVAAALGQTAQTWGLNFQLQILVLAQLSQGSSLPVLSFS
jgi:hypothetical protein